jgi:hypothetical protein
MQVNAKLRDGMKLQTEARKGELKRERTNESQKMIK